MVILFLIFPLSKLWKESNFPSLAFMKGHFIFFSSRITRFYTIQAENFLGRTPRPPLFHVTFTISTRAPRGTDRSPEYNEHFCYKLDSRVKHLTTQWNQKQQHFITHASRLLLWIRFVAVAFRSEEVFWRRGHPPWPILPRQGSAPGQIWQKHLYACARPWAIHPYQVS